MINIASTAADSYEKCDMFNGFLLVFDTARTWERIRLTPCRWQSVLLTHFLPLLLMTSLLEGYSLTHWGRLHGEMHQMKIFGLAEAIAYEAAQFTLTLVMIFSCTKMIQSLGETFHGRHNFAQPFVALAYGLSPLIMLRFFDAFPGMSPWVTWGIGIILTISTLYHGLPCIMQPDPPHAFGLFITSSVLLFITSGLVRFVTTWYLEGKFEKLERFLFPV